MESTASRSARMARSQALMVGSSPRAARSRNNATAASTGVRTL